MASPPDETHSQAWSTAPAMRRALTRRQPALPRREPALRLRPTLRRVGGRGPVGVVVSPSAERAPRVSFGAVGAVAGPRPASPHLPWWRLLSRLRRLRADRRSRRSLGPGATELLRAAPETAPLAGSHGVGGAPRSGKRGDANRRPEARRALPTLTGMARLVRALPTGGRHAPAGSARWSGPETSGAIRPPGDQAAPSSGGGTGVDQPAAPLATGRRVSPRATFGRPWRLLRPVAPRRASWLGQSHPERLKDMEAAGGGPRTAAQSKVPEDRGPRTAAVLSSDGPLGVPPGGPLGVPPDGPPWAPFAGPPEIGGPAGPVRGQEALRRRMSISPRRDRGASPDGERRAGPVLTGRASQARSGPRAAGEGQRGQEFASPFGARSLPKVSIGRALPAWSLPLARRLVRSGPLPVVATGPEVSSALRAAGTKAAATSSAIYLDSSPDRSPASVEVLAHELSHVAERPVAPRFFLDRVLDRAEERARAVGETARTSAERAETSAERAGSEVRNAGGLVGGVTGAEGAPGPLSALSGAPAEASEMAGSLAAEASGLAGEVSGVVRGAEERVAAGVGQVKAAAGFGASDLDGLLEALEERIVSELERRGGRMAGAF
jgi:hypothetical protein